MKNLYLLLVLASFLAACGGESKVGNQSDADPIAEAGVFGANLNTAGTVAVRAGSDVLLSGQNSEGVDDPILSFEWRQLNPEEYSVVLYERTSNAVVFTAPQIPLNETEGVDLEFELTIQDADGKQDVDSVIVKVMPSGDRNHFLSRPLNNETFALIVVPDTGVTLSEDVPVSISITETVAWTDRQGNPRSQSVRTRTLRGTVPEGVSESVTSKANEYFIESVPMLNADEVNQYFQGELRDGRLEFEAVESANLIIDITLNQQALGDLRLYLARNAELGLQLIETADVSTGLNRFQLTSDWLRQKVNIESKLSASNYYKCIDPDDQAATLSGWIEQAGFIGADDIYHSTYLNNFDLNFGRDMWVRTDDNGNVYSYVVNSPTLENALTGRNDFATVVMEFSPAPTGNCGDATFAAQDGKKIVKFYAYVPDENTGEYVRAPTMNFDGRGERSLPGVCIACHFGDANAEEFNVADFRAIDASAADLNSSFMIWDLDSFLYTSDDDDNRIDRVYGKNEISPEITAAFSRGAQEDVFRAQNQAVLHTFTYDTAQLKRFEPAIKLLHGMYQNAEAIESLDFGTEEMPLDEASLSSLRDVIDTLPENDFDGENYVQTGWAGEEALYHKVFARNCRLCHAQIGEALIDFDSYDEFINNERLVPYVFEQGLMPLSRLTMDRFWNDFYGEQSAAEFLRDHLNSDTLPENDVAAELLPGAPVAVVVPGENPDAEADVVVDFDGDAFFDATASLFSDSFQWRVDGRLVSTDDKLGVDIVTPGARAEVELIAFNSNNFLTSEAITRSVLVQNNTPTISSVPAQATIEGTQLDISVFELICPGAAPDSNDCRPFFGDIREGETPTITTVGDAVNGNVIDVDSATGVVQFESTASEAAGSATFVFQLSDSFGESSDELTMSITINSLSGPEIGSPDTCTSEAASFANSFVFPLLFNAAPCLDPSENDSAADGLSLTLVSVDDTSLQDGGSVTIANGTIAYTPGRFFVGQDSFSYAVQDDSPSAKSSTGTVLVTVEAQALYSELASATGVFGAALSEGGCVDCHVGGGLSEFSWVDYAQIRAAVERTERSINGGGIPLQIAEPTTTEELLNSIVFKHACNYDGSHTGGNLLCNSAGTPTVTDDLNDAGLRVLRWIEEGAREN